tara:strand:+ start:28964 stop:31222 length:2259 start_codon:yes stop_codon:yes gene_type:complete
MTDTRHFRRTSLVLALLVPCGLTLSPATSANSVGVLEELVVTATRREASLQDVPVAVSLLSGTAIAEAHLVNAAELTQMIASLNAQTGATASDSSFNIRGIGTQAFSAGAEPSVSTMIDGVVLSRSGMAFSSMLDVQRVEVLRGPQGTLYGKNASGGVIHIITRDPTPEWAGTLSATAIEKDEYRLGATISGPLGDTVGMRLTGMWIDDDGYATNVYDGSRLNGGESTSLRGKLSWQPRDDFDLMWSADYYDSDCKCNALTVRAVLESDQREALLEELQPVVPSDDNFDANNNQKTRDEVTAWGNSLTMNKALGAYEVTSITAYRNWENTQTVDVDNRPTNPLTLMLDSPPHTEVDQFSQELRLSSNTADWGHFVLGAFYFTQDNKTRTVASHELFVPILPPVVSDSRVKVDSENMALYGEMTYNIKDDLRGVLGGRYTRDELDFEAERIGGDGLVFPLPHAPRGDDVSKDNFSPKIAVEWDVNDSAMLYASYVSGYKGPAFDVEVSVVTDPIEPEESDSYELGLKSAWLDDRLILNVALYYAEYKNFQAQALIDENPDDELPAEFLLQNAGDVSTRGVELDLIGRVNDNWNISGGLAYTDGRIDDFEAGNCSQGQIFRGECPGGSQDLSGGDLPYTPKWKLTFSTNYRQSLPGLPFDLLAVGNVRWQDDVLYQNSQDPNNIQKAYTIVDLSLAALEREGGYSLSVFVKNALDEDFSSLIFAHSDVLIPHGYMQFKSKYARRTAGIELRYDW